MSDEEEALADGLEVDVVVADEGPALHDSVLKQIGLHLKFGILTDHQNFIYKLHWLM